MKQRLILSIIICLLALVMALFAAGRGIGRDPADRPPGAVTQPGIVVLGTSLSHLGDWPDRLAAGLAACGAQVGAVTRITRIGANASWGADQLDAVVAADPGLVLIEFAINDADIRDGLWPGESRAVLTGIVAELSERLPKARLALMTMNPAVGYYRLSRPFQAHYNGLVRAVAAEQATGLIDLAPRWAVARSEGRVVIADGRHPSKGEMAEVALPVLLEHLGAAYGVGPC